ncbi:DUF4432 family protein [Aminobacter carboxidus]|uniref:DUF4432 family protein n=1 Tax=Aminobacter carboxidus TaxID=376165 RepID=A0ABR9GGI7_9HYPH|nr:DUF4432 family protein [Aminobacter carboxidus]MBE1202763.1 DUF4432 family protein [Aminobacter carboxidus]
MKNAAELRPLVGDLRQLASVRRITLDDGPERGVRALAFSTGGGLDFWVIADRSLDIGTLHWKGEQLSWQSPAGFRAASLHAPEGDAGFGFNRSFGGFLVTCGLDHIRQPVNGLPLHGHLPHTPARLLNYGENWDAKEPVLFCEGEIMQWRYGAETFRLRRRIEAPIGGGVMRLIDSVDNIGPTPQNLVILYHFNLGYPGIVDGSTVMHDSATVLDRLTMPDGSEPAPATIRKVSAMTTSECVVETPVADGTRCISFRFDAKTLPYLQLWRDLRPRCGVLSIEPCNAAKAADGSNETTCTLKPGETATFQIEISICDAATQPVAPNTKETG